MAAFTLANTKWLNEKTSGVDIFAKIVDNVESLQDEQRLAIYDFSGRQVYWQHVFEPLAKEITNYILVFDFANKSSLESLKQTISKLKSNRTIKLGNVVVVGNKSDLTNRAVNKAEVDSFVKETGYAVREVSIKDYEKVCSVFLDFLKGK